MKKYLCFLIIWVSVESNAQTLGIRGVLPWHNFLSGPTAWNEDDYRKYLDDCQKEDLNFIAFHNYTGGGERYFNYVEPMIKIKYKNVLPEAAFDNSGMARWGYLPMKVKDFADGTDKLFKLPAGVEYFGADCSVLARTNEERYDKAQSLMQKVLHMAHERNIQMAMGFEFGVAPPEYASIRTHGDMYWMGDGSLVYNPFDPDADGILYATIDNILETYKGIDWIYLWLNEHCMFGVNPTSALKNKLMKEYYDDNEKYYHSDNNSLKFLGVWAQAYIQRAYDYIKLKSPETKIVIGGWGGESQMALLLQGLDKSLPKDVVFSMLNPGQGRNGHPDFFKEIAKNRKVWAIPWLEGDASLWHLQPRVEDMQKQVRKAFNDDLNGVVAIHWRTEEIQPNRNAFVHFASHPESKKTTLGIYQDYCREQFGSNAADRLAPELTRLDTTGILRSIGSPEFFAYQPSWGRLNAVQVDECNRMIGLIRECISNEKEAKMGSNLNWFKSCFEFTLLLNEVGIDMEPAWNLRDAYLTGMGKDLYTKEQIGQAKNTLKKAPVEKMITVFASRVRSRGELGELSSINQKVWGEYQQLNAFLKNINNKNK